MSIATAATIMSTEQKKFGLVIHGGAGTIERGKLTPERAKGYRDGLEPRSLPAPKF